MADVTTVSSEDEFVQSIVSDEDLSITDDGAAELWDIWQYRHNNGADNDVLVALPDWFAQDEFGKNRPYFFASIERDEDDSGAILFSDARLIDISIIENGVWDDVTISETVELLDVTDDNEYIDEKGKVWTPRSLMSIFAIEDTASATDDGNDITDIASMDDD
jgi:hypothetical protein